METGRFVEKFERYYLVLKMAVFSSENRFPFITLFCFYPIVSTYEFELSELFGLT